MTSARGPLTRQDLIEAAASAEDMPKVKANAVVAGVLDQLPASAAVRFRPGKDLKSSLTFRPA
jgi:hypothetical protein